jgi:hypothetical protein
LVALDDGFVDGAVEMIGIGEGLMGEKEYREFRLWAMTVEREEASHGTTQTPCHSGSAFGPIIVWSGRKDGIRQGRLAGRVEEGFGRASIERGDRSSS